MKPASPSLVSKTAYADAILNSDLDPEARKQIARLRDQWAADKEIVTRRPGVRERINCKSTHGRDLERTKEIDSFLAGTVRLIHVSSIYEYLIKQVLATFPLNQPPRKAPGAPYLALARASIARSRPAPTHVQERAAPPSPASEAKRPRGRPRRQIEQSVPSPAE